MLHVPDLEVPEVRSRMTKPPVLKILILLTTLYAMLMMLHWPIGFTFFTQLSNLYAALIVILQLLFRRPGKRLVLWKYTAAVSITMTFLVYLFALAPAVPGGLLAAYAQDHCASLCMHLITPVLTVWDFLKNDAPASDWDNRFLPLSALPPFAYFAFILILGQCGFRWWDMSAPYPFLNYTAPAGWFGFLPETAGYTTLGIGVFYVVIAMTALFLLSGWLLLAAAKHRHNAGA